MRINLESTGTEREEVEAKEEELKEGVTKHHTFASHLEFPFRQDQRKRWFREQPFAAPRAASFFEVLKAQAGETVETGMSGTLRSWSMEHDSSAMVDYYRARKNEEANFQGDSFESAAQASLQSRREQARERHRERKEVLDESSGIKSWAARGVGWMVGTLSDPLELAALFTGSKLGSTVVKQLGQQGLKKRLIHDAVMGASYAGLKEPVEWLKEGEEGEEKKGVGESMKRIVMSAAAFPVLGESTRLIGKGVKTGWEKGWNVFRGSVYFKPTGSAYLDALDLASKIQSRKTPDIFYEGLEEFNAFRRASFLAREKAESIQSQIDGIKKLKPTYTEDLLLKEIDGLREIQGELYREFGVKNKAHRRIQALEATLAEHGLGLKEETELGLLKTTHKVSVLERDNLLELTNLLIENRVKKIERLLGQQGKRLDEDVLAVADYQVQQGKKLNLGEAVKAKEKTKGEMKGEAKGEVNEKGKEGGPPHSKELLTKSIESTAVEDNPGEILSGKTAQELNQRAAENLMKHLLSFKDLKRGMTVLVDRIGNEARGYFGKLSNALYLELQEKGLMEYFNVGAKMWSKELARCTDASLEKSGSSFAEQVARILFETRNRLLRRAKEAGINIQELEGYIVRQTHAKKALRKVGFQTWKEFIVPLLDEEKTFGEKTLTNEAQEQWLQQAFEHLKKGGEMDSVLFSSSQGRSLARTGERCLHFKHPEAAYLYNERFGALPFSELYLMGLHTLANRVVLAEQLGVHPQVVLRRVYIALRPLMQQQGVKAERALDEFVPTMERYLQLHRNAYLYPSHTWIEEWGEKLRAMTSMAKLGYSTLSSLPDLWTVPNALKNIGMPALEADLVSFKNILLMFSPKRRKETLELMGTVIEGTLADFYNRMGAMSSLSAPSVEASSGQWHRKGLHLFFQFNLQRLWDSAIKSGTSEAVSQYIGTQIKKSFRQLPTGLKNSLIENGLTEQVWPLLQAAFKTVNPRHALEHGKLLSRHLDRLSVDALKPFFNEASEEELFQLREQLSGRYQGLLMDIADQGIPTGTRITDRDIMSGHRVASSPLAKEVISGLLQFKHFSIMFCRHQLARTLRRATSIYEQEAGAFGAMRASFQGGGIKKPLSVYGALGSLLLGAYALDYLSLSIKDVFRGNLKLEDFGTITPKRLERTLKYGSMLGIYQDVLRDVLDNPTSLFVPASASIPMDVLAKPIKKLGTEEFIPQLIDGVYKSLPFGNLFYLQALLQRGVVEPLERYVSPSFVRKKEQSRRARQREYI